MIDPNEAPEGYVAVAETAECEGCAFSAGTKCTKEALWGNSCTDAGRADGEPVIFIKREEAMNITTHGFAGAMKAEDVRNALTAGITELHRLRDEFAKAAMTGMLADEERSGNAKEYAKDAFMFADAMLAAKFATMTWGKK